jgi:hypothetical protein
MRLGQLVLRVDQDGFLLHPGGKIMAMKAAQEQKRAEAQNLVISHKNILSLSGTNTTL